MTTERLLLDAIGKDEAHRILCSSTGSGQLAAELAHRWPGVQVTCHFLDLFLAQQATKWLAQAGSRVQAVCTADFPESEYDLVALPCSARGDGELTRDFLQSGFLRLGVAGRLFAATDNPRDTWLGDQMERFFRKVLRTTSRRGVVYSGIKIDPLRKVKNYDCEFVFRDGPRLVRTVSRPSVFSHRRLDIGARALIESMDVPEGARVLELGCGSGAISLAAAQRAPNVTVTAVDVNPRAIECVERGAALNGLCNIKTVHDADARCVEPGTYDLVVANPPYYSRFRIGEIFVQGAYRALRIGGVLLLVTKQPDAYLARIQFGFGDATVMEVRQYGIVRAVRLP